MSRLLHRLGTAAASRPWRVLGAWLTLLIALGLAAGTVGGDLYDDYDVPGTRSLTATEQLREHFPAMSGADARVVLHGDRALTAEQVEGLRSRLTGLPHVSAVTAQPSPDGDTALLSVQYDVGVTDFTGGIDALEGAAGPSRADGLQVELGGSVVENGESSSSGHEVIGLAVALVVLLVAFGSVAAAGVPLAVALVGLGAGLSLVTVLAAVTDISTAAPMVAAMVGVGVGIDYALLLVTRTVEGLRAGLGRVEAVGRANATAGTSVLFAGGTVLLSLLGLRFSGLPVLQSFGWATGIVLLFVVAAALTLVPALASLAGPRLISRRSRRALAARATGTDEAATSLAGGTTDLEDGATARWAARVARRPLAWGTAALVLLIALAAPATVMRTWPQDSGSEPTSTTQRRAYDLVAAEFGPGANGPLLLAVDRTVADADQVRAAVAGTPGVASVTPPLVSPDGALAVLVAQPDWGPMDERVVDLVGRLRADTLPQGAEITGWTASFVDISDLLAERLWLVIGFVVAVSLLLLVVVFRSVVVPVKAAAMNLLSVGAAYGVLVIVFQWGWGAQLFGLPHAVPVSSWVPILLFAVLFGLSMDYEVFLLGRVREEWLRTGDARGSVIRGLGATGRVITSAALIMVAVFVSFGLSGSVVTTMIGVGLASAVLIDATVIRMVLAPAAMVLLGDANWWLPAWLDRRLPQLRIDAGEEADREELVTAA